MVTQWFCTGDTHGEILNLGIKNLDDIMRCWRDGKTLNWKNVLATCTRYNIPLDAKIQLATGWECGPTGADTLYYNICENILAIVDNCNEWYNTADWILIGKLEEILNK